MIKWAEREVEIACKKENPNRKEGEWDYGCACYESALKAYKSLCEDNHSGFSFSLTKGILDRLMNSLPLTPITDEDFFLPDNSSMPGDEEGEHLKQRGIKSVKQCPRMSSLFRYEYLDDRIEYRDVERFYCYDKDNPDGPTWGTGGVIVEELNKKFPITMPYYPPIGYYKLECSEALSDPKNGDFDTVGIFYGITPTGERFEINRYFTDKDGEFVEIHQEDYDYLQEKAEARLKKEKEEPNNKENEQ